MYSLNTPTGAPRRGTSAAVAGILTLLVGGCPQGGVVDEGGTAGSPGVGLATAGLNGNVSFPDSSCSTNQRGRITDAVRAADTVLDDPDFKDCLVNSFMTYKEKAPYPEYIISELKQNKPTDAYCIEGSQDAAAAAQVGINHEEIYFSYGWLNDYPTAAEGAAVVLHEIAHNKGYTHATDVNNTSSQNYDSAYEYRYTVPMQVQACAAAVASGFGAQHGPRRDELTDGTVLAAVGLDGGQLTHSSRCGSTGRASGLRAVERTGTDKIASVRLMCEDGIDSQSVGSNAGDLFSFDCGFGNHLVGIRGDANTILRGVRAVCANDWDIWTEQTQNYYTLPGRAGNTNGPAFDRICPPGQIVSGLRGRTGWLVDQLEVECSPYFASDRYYDRTITGFGGGGGKRYFARCQRGGRLVGLFGHSGARVDRLGGMCESPEGRRLLQAHGGLGGKVRQSSCQSGYALVGLRGRYGNYVDSIQGICAHVGNWNNGTRSYSYLSNFGSNSGGSVDRICPLGEFLVGWNMGAGALVDSIQPLCSPDP